MITPSLNGHNMHSACAWDWLARKVTTPPPRVLLTLTADFIQKCAPTHATLKHTMLGCR